MGLRGLRDLFLGSEEPFLLLALREDDEEEDEEEEEESDEELEEEDEDEDALELRDLRGSF